MNSFQEAIPKPINFEKELLQKTITDYCHSEWTPNCWINIECPTEAENIY
jgi:hypothetical protein